MFSSHFDMRLSTSDTILLTKSNSSSTSSIDNPNSRIMSLRQLHSFGLALFIFIHFSFCSYSHFSHSSLHFSIIFILLVFLFYTIAKFIQPTICPASLRTIAPGIYRSFLPNTLPACATGKLAIYATP